MALSRSFLSLLLAALLALPPAHFKSAEANPAAAIRAVRAAASSVTGSVPRVARVGPSFQSGFSVSERVSGASAPLAAEHDDVVGAIASNWPATTMGATGSPLMAAHADVLGQKKPSFADATTIRNWPADERTRDLITSCYGDGFEAKTARAALITGWSSDLSNFRSSADTRQSTLVKLIERLDADCRGMVKSIGAFLSSATAYALGALRNARIDVARRVSREKKHVERLSSLTSPMTASTASPEDTVLASESVEAMLGLLTAKQREAAELVFIEGYTLAQAAERLGISVDSVKDRLAAVRTKVREAATTSEPSPAGLAAQLSPSALR